MFKKFLLASMIFMIPQVSSAKIMSRSCHSTTDRGMENVQILYDNKTMSLVMISKEEDKLAAEKIDYQHIDKGILYISREWAEDEKKYMLIGMFIVDLEESSDDSKEGVVITRVKKNGEPDIESRDYFKWVCKTEIKE